MLSRFNKLLITLIVVAIACYAFYLNPQVVTLALGIERNITLPLGILMLVVFASGVLLSALVALWFGLRAYLRERKLLSRDRQRQQFVIAMTQARSLMACAEYGKARRAWEDLIDSDPSAVIARLELSRCYEELGDLREALKVVDQARANQPKNLEALMRAAELNQRLGNRTAAIDNLALTLAQHPTLRAATVARDLSEELGQIEDALEYQSHVERLDNSDADYAPVATRLAFRSLLKQHANDRAALRSALATFVAKNPSSVEAAEELLRIDARGSSPEEHAKSLVRLAKLTRDADLWRQAIELWIQAKNPDRAISTARAAVAESSDDARSSAKLTLARVYTAFGMHEEAQRTIAELENIRLDGTAAREHLLLKALSAIVRGESREASELLSAACALPGASRNLASNAPYVQSGATVAPEPRLSTP